MLKAGFVGTLTDEIFNDILVHPGFKLTGTYDPGINHFAVNNVPDSKVPAVSEVNLLLQNEVLFIQHTGPETLDIVTNALKHSRHLMLMNIECLDRAAVTLILKFHREAGTVLKVGRIERANAALQACGKMIINPSLFEVKLMQVNKTGFSRKRGETAIMKMLDALLFLCPLNIQKLQSLRNPAKYTSDGLVHARIEFDNGSVASLLFSELSEDDSFTIDVYQDKMLVRVDMLRESLHRIERPGNGGAVTSLIQEFKSRSSRPFENDLDDLYKLITSKNNIAKDLFEASRLLDLTRKIMEKN
jgi:hypothetical protein